MEKSVEHGSAIALYSAIGGDGFVVFLDGARKTMATRAVSHKI